MSQAVVERPAKQVRHFSQLLVWRKAHQLFLEVAQAFELAQRSRAAWVIEDQVLRSVGAISALIAEGFNAPTTKEYLYYLNRAKRSGHETENWLYKVRDLKIVNGDAAPRHLDSCAEIIRMLDGLSRSLSAKRR